jgi:hypothetical protein
MDRRPVQQPVKPVDRPVATTEKPSGTGVMFGNVSVALPDGWREIGREPDRVTFGSADESEQATVSKMDFRAVPSFEDFQRMCQHRLDAERQESQSAVLQVTGPSNAGGKYTLMYSGGDQASARLFSGYLVVVGTTLMTVYVEGIGVTPERHLASFKDFVAGLRPGPSTGSMP